MKKGFTLIEILIVVVIIGILAGVVLSIIKPDVLYSRARDSRRETDLKTIQTGLENYYAEYRGYFTDKCPPAGTIAADTRGWVDASTLVAALGDPDCSESNSAFINNTPTDPKSGQNYWYWSTGSKYCLAATAENLVSDTSKLCSALKNATSLCTDVPVPDPTMCLGVENPF